MAEPGEAIVKGPGEDSDSVPVIEILVRCIPLDLLDRKSIFLRLHVKVEVAPVRRQLENYSLFSEGNSLPCR